MRRVSPALEDASDVQLTAVSQAGCEGVAEAGQLAASPVLQDQGNRTSLSEGEGGGIHVQSKDLVLVLQLLICCESDLRVSSLSSSSRLLKAALTSTALLVAMLDLLQHTVPVS